jgi:TfoX/Sxy family transcriptional regulator of competence genes
MTTSKSTSVAESLFRAMAGQLSDVTMRQMFGCPCAFVSGQMFAGVFQSRIFLRLDPQTREQTLERSADLFAPGGPAMKQYVLFRESIHDQERELTKLFQKSHAFARSLPPKKPKPRPGKRPRRP